MSDKWFSLLEKISWELDFLLPKFQRIKDKFMNFQTKKNCLTETLKLIPLKLNLKDF